MGVNYDNLARAVVDWVVQNGQPERIVALDLESKVLSPNEFLTGETILSFAMARRVGTNVETKLFILEDETSRSQHVLFTSISQEIERIRPLVVVGYNITGYDIPLLRIKLRSSQTPYWALIDLVERSFPLDMKYPIKFELARVDGSSPKIRTLEDVVNHARFSHLKLSKAKNTLNGLDKSQKGQRIYHMWKENKADFSKYAIGDAADVLLLFEELFQSREAVVSARIE